MNRFCKMALIGAGCYALLVGCNRADQQTPASQVSAVPVIEKPPPPPATRAIGKLPPRTLEDLENAVLVAYLKRDTALLNKLIYPRGVTSEQRSRRAKAEQKIWGRPVTQVRAVPLDKQMKPKPTTKERPYKSNLKPLGLIRLDFFLPNNGYGSSQISSVVYPYGLKNGAYYLVASVRAKK